MDTREKLMELLGNIYLPIMDGPCVIGEYRIPYKFKEEIADHLIANGVTVQEWVSVTERLPEEGEYVLCVLKGFSYGGKIQVCKFVPADKFKEKPYFEHFRNGFPTVTHWMPLPQSPKGE